MAPVFLPGEFHGQRSLLGYSLWGHKELNTTERLTLSFFGSSLVAQMVKNLPAMQETWGSIPRLGRSPGEGNISNLQKMEPQRDVIFAGWQSQTLREDLSRMEYIYNVEIKVKNCLGPINKPY